MSEGLSTENETIIVTGVALFLFGSLVTLVSNLKFSEYIDSLVPGLKLFLVIASLTTVLAIYCGSLSFLINKSLDNKRDLKKIAEAKKFTEKCMLISRISLLMALVTLLAYLLLYITESLGYTELFLCLAVPGFIIVNYYIFK